MKDFILSLRSELTKVKNSFAFWLVILGAAFIPFFLMVNYIYRWKNYLPSAGVNPWHEYLRNGFNSVHFTFLPLLIVLLVTLLLNIEYKSNTWKHLFVQPVSKTSIFFSKYLVLILLIILFYLLTVVFFLSGGALLSLWKSEFNFFSYSPSYYYKSVESGIVSYIFRSFVSVSGIIAIHFWLSFRLKNLFLNIGIGLAGLIIAVSMVIGNWGSVIYMPYAFPVLMCNFIPAGQTFLSNFQINSLFCFMIISFLSYIDFIKIFRG
jgi:lantibiotic transport system permease protein